MCVSQISAMYSFPAIRRAYQFIGQTNINQFMGRRNQIEFFAIFSLVYHVAYQ